MQQICHLYLTKFHSVADENSLQDDWKHVNQKLNRPLNKIGHVNTPPFTAPECPSPFMAQGNLAMHFRAEQITIDVR